MEAPRRLHVMSFVVPQKVREIQFTITKSVKRVDFKAYWDDAKFIRG
jgi:hypothetical protein